MLGLDGLALLTCTDPAEALMREAVFKQADRERQRRDRNLAVEIATQVGKLFP